MIAAIRDCVVIRTTFVMVDTTTNRVQPGVPGDRNHAMQGQQQNGNMLDEIAFHGTYRQGRKPLQLPAFIVIARPSNCKLNPVRHWLEIDYSIVSANRFGNRFTTPV